MKEYLKKMLSKVRIPAAIGILLWPTVAMADPASALMLLGTLLTKTALAWLGYTLIAGTIIYGTVDARRRARNAAENAKNEFNRNLQDRSQTILTQLPPWTIRYGRTMAGSTVAAIFTTDKAGVRENGDPFVKKDAYKHIVYVHASHECAAAHGYRINGIDVGELDDDGWALNPVFRLPTEYGFSAVKTVEIAPLGSHVATAPVQILKSYDKALTTTSGGYYGLNFYLGTIPTSTANVSADGKTISNPSSTITLVVKYAYASGASTLRISTHLGSPTQTVDTYLNSLIPDKWTANHRLRGRCYSVVTVDLENTDFQGGVPQFEADLSGKLLFDPRSSTTAYSTNWALVIRDWISSVWGADADPADINDASVIVAANASDVSISVPVRSYTDATLWSFAAGAESFTGVNASVAASGGTITVTGTSTNRNTPFAVQRTGLSIVGASNRYIRARIRRLSGVNWMGMVQYTTAGHGFSNDFYALKPVGMKVAGAYQEVVWDMHSLRSGANDWKNNTITGIAILLGKGLGDSFQIDWIAVSNESTVTVTEPKYTVNAVFTTEEGRESVLNNLLTAGAGNAYNGGEWIVTPGAWSSPVMTLDDSDLVGQVQIVQADAGIDELFNGVRGTYFEAGKSVAKEMKPYLVPTLVTEDGKELWEDVAFPYTDNEQRVQNLARIMVERVRSGQILQYPASLRAFPLRIGDRVTVNNAEYGFSSKTYVVTDWNFGQTSPVLLTLQEDSAVIWDLADQVVFDQTPNTQLNDPRFILPYLQSEIIVESGTEHLVKELDGTITTRIHLTWPLMKDAHMAGDTAMTDIVWQRVMRDDVNTWRRLSVPANQGFTYLLGAVTGDTVVIGLRPKNSLGFAAEYVYVTHEVVGETQAASDVSGFTATPFAGGILYTWNQASDPDYASTELRVGASWVSGTQIFRGSANRFFYARTNTSTVTVFAKHYDRTGNASTNAVSASAAAFTMDDTRNYDFTNGLTGWTNISSVSTGDTGASGGTYGTHSGPIGSPAYPAMVPVDPNRRYRVTARVWADAGGGGPVYVGVIPFDSSGAALSNTGGATYPYCASGGTAIAGPGWRVFSGEISGTQPRPSATYSLSKFPVGTVYASPMVFPHTGYTGPLLIDYLVLEDITDVKEVEADNFSVYRMWDFNTITTEGFTGSNATLAANGTMLEVTATAADAIFRTPDLSFSGAIFDKIRMRVRRLSGTSWQGDVYYITNGGHNESDLYKLTLPASEQPTWPGWKVLEWDVSKHATDATDWRGSDITKLRFDLSQGGVGDKFEIDWIAIGKNSGPVDVGIVTNAQWVSRGVSVVGDTAVKSRPLTGWNSDVYSREQFYGGAAASASFDTSTSRACMFGLNSDPLTDADYASLDYAFYYTGTQIEIYESGAARGVFVASPLSTDVYTVAYDGSSVYYLRNGSLLRSVKVTAGLSFFFDSSFLNEGAMLRGMRFGPLTSNNWTSIGGDAKPSDYATSDLTLVNDANCVQSGNRATKVSGGNAWNAGMRTRNAYAGGAYISVYFTTGMTATLPVFAFGLNDSSLTANFTDINFGLSFDSGNVNCIQEGSLVIGNITTFADGDFFEITYDGVWARYYKNGALLNQTNVVNQNPFFGDMSIWRQDTYIDRISFGPMTSNNWNDVGGSGKPSDDATADLVLVNSGNCTQTGNRITKTGGTNAWNGGMHSRDGYVGGASCSIYVHASQTDASKEAMFGLNNSPTTASFTDINFAFYLLGAGAGVGNLYVYLEGTIGNGAASVGTYADNDILSVTYDGYKARWYKNGSLLYEIVSIDTTSRWHFDSAILQVGEYFDRVSFRPMSMVSGIASVQLANDIQSDNFSAGSAGWRIRRSDGSAELGAAAIRGVLSAANIIGSAAASSRSSNTLTLTSGAVQNASFSAPTGMTLEVHSSTSTANVEGEFIGDLVFALNASFTGGGGTYVMHVDVIPSFDVWNGSSWVALAHDNNVKKTDTVTLTGSEVLRMPISVKERVGINTGTYSQVRVRVDVVYAGFRQLVVNGSATKTDCLASVTWEGKFYLRQTPD